MLALIFCILLAVAVLGSELELNPNHCAVAFVKLSANALFLIIPRELYKSELIWLCGNSYTIEEIGLVISLILTGNHLFLILWFFKVLMLFMNTCSSMKIFPHIASLVTLILYRLSKSCSVLCQSSIMFTNDVHHQS